MIKLLSTRCEEPFGSCHPIMSSRLESNSEKRLQRVLGDCVKNYLDCTEFYQTFVYPPNDTWFQNLSDKENRS